MHLIAQVAQTQENVVMVCGFSVWSICHTYLEVKMCLVTEIAHRQATRGNTVDIEPCMHRYVSALVTNALTKAI